MRHCWQAKDHLSAVCSESSLATSNIYEIGPNQHWGLCRSGVSDEDDLKITWQNCHIVVSCIMRLKCMKWYLKKKRSKQFCILIALINLHCIYTIQLWQTFSRIKFGFLLSLKFQISKESMIKDNASACWRLCHSFYLLFPVLSFSKIINLVREKVRTPEIAYKGQPRPNIRL